MEDKNTVIIRDVTTDDSSAIAEIYRDYILNTTISFELEPVDSYNMSKRISSVINSHFPYFVAETDDEIIGYCYAHAWKDRPAYNATWETTVYIRADFKRHHIGRLLMEKLIEESSRRGCKVLVACITADNNDSIEFHRSLGFVKASHFKKVGFKFGGYLDVIDMQLILPACHPNSLS